MIIRLATIEDKEQMIKSFKPLFADWDYLAMVIDDWLNGDEKGITWVACDGDNNEMLVAMAHTYEIEPGDWYMRGLRSNPSASYIQNANAVIGIARAIEKEVRSRNAQRVRYGTIDYFEESLRLSEILKFREFFRLAQAFHKPLANPVEQVRAATLVQSENLEEVYEFFSESETIKNSEGYFFTWWDTRTFRKECLIKAIDNNYLFEVRDGGKLDGAMLLYPVPWQKHMVLSIMEGSYESLIALFNKAMERSKELEYKSFGLVHPSHQEMYHRQNLFGLTQHGNYTVQFIRDDSEKNPVQ